MSFVSGGGGAKQAQAAARKRQQKADTEAAREQQRAERGVTTRARTRALYTGDLGARLPEKAGGY